MVKMRLVAFNVVFLFLFIKGKDAVFKYSRKVQVYCHNFAVGVLADF